jgi:transcriptional antiterminator RfaH
MSKEWFILQFKANSQQQAKKNLERQKFDTFLPFHVTTSRKGSRFIVNSKPLFPGYMFVLFDRANSDWHRINSTYGVSRLVTFNSVLKSVPTTFIDNLMIQYDSSSNLLPVKKLKKGDQVKVLKGPFANFIATVETYETEERMWVLLDLMGRKTKTQTHLNTLQPTN